MLGRVSNKTLTYVPEMNEVRTELGDDAVLFLKKLVAQRPDDPTLKRRYANLCLLAANNHLNAFRMDRVFQYHDEVDATYRELIAADPTNSRYINATIWADLDRAEALGKTSDLDDAIKLIKRAVEKAERNLRGDPGSTHYRHTLGRARYHLGDALVLVGDQRAAILELDTAIDQLAALILEHPEDETSRRYLVYCYLSRGVAAVDCNEGEAAGATFASGTTELDRWQDVPGCSRVEVDYCRAILLNEQGRWLAARGRPATAALSVHEAALGLMEDLCRKYPTLPEYQIELGLDRAESRAGPAGHGPSAVGRRGKRPSASRGDPRAPGPKVRGDPPGSQHAGPGQVGPGPIAVSAGGLREPAIRLVTQALDHHDACLRKNRTSPRDLKSVEECKTFLESNAKDGRG